LVGFCNGCHSWLGKNQEADPRYFEDNTFQFKKWVAQSFARLLDHEATHQKQIRSDCFALMIEEGIQRNFDGNAAAFGRHIGRQKSVICGWRRGQVMPSAFAIATISFAFQIPLECLFTGDKSAWDFSVPQPIPYPIRELLPTKKTARTIPWDAHRIFLTRVVGGELGWIKSFSHAARELHMDAGSLRRRFPQLANEVVKYCSVRRQQETLRLKAEQNKELLIQARLAVSALRARGEGPSRRKIVAELARNGIRVHRQHFQLLRQATMPTPSEPT
jgi:hypothetical protein